MTPTAPTSTPDRTGIAAARTGRSEIVDQLARIADSGDFAAALRRSAEVADAAGQVPDPAGLTADLTAFARTDAFAALLAIESLSEVRDDGAGDVLAGLLDHPSPAVRRHAAWRLGAHRPSRHAVAPLLDQLTWGGIDTMHAHRTLRRWSVEEPAAIATAALAAVDVADTSAARARLVDLLGVLPDPRASAALQRLATDRSESVPVRAAAIGALGSAHDDRIASMLGALAEDDRVGAHAALALDGRGEVSSADASGGDGLRVAQLVLAGGLDGQLSLGGRGDTGGVASLLVSLGDALAARDDVDHVLTIGRGGVTDALMGPPIALAGTPSYGTIALGCDGRAATTPDQTWEHAPSIEREVRRILRAAGPIDVLHLRMADAGTLAGADVAAELGIPICFSVAPDPHNVIQSLQSRGELDREGFVRLDAEHHVWFRARLVERLTREADRLAMFPRAHPTELLADLGLELAHEEHRAATVAEGIDVGLVRRAEARQHADGSRRPATMDVVGELAARIPSRRRHLPLLLSVGRLHPVKGMDRIVAAWASDPSLHGTCNLVIVGGDLDEPSATERAVLDAIDVAVPPGDSRRAGLVLLGGRPRSDVADLLVATVEGFPGHWESGGVYVDGALKEEFGLALIEALAAGLVVTAPSTGGPATYVEHGDTGILVDPDADLANAIGAAFGLVDRPGRRTRARRMVEERYSIESMAAQLVELYRAEPALL